MMSESFDLLIVGGGIAGSALALALADSNIRIALVEAQAPDLTPMVEENIHGFDLRVCALTHASQSFLQRMGVWQNLSQQRVSPYRFMQVWDAQGTGSIRFDAAELHQQQLGHIVENRLLVAALQQKLQLTTNVVNLAPRKVEFITALEEGYRIKLEEGLCLDARLLVGADGATSRVRQWADMATREWDYGHHALVATVQTAEPHQDTAWQRFRDNGPLAFLPLASEDKTYSSIVWSTTPEESQALLDLSDEEFCARLGSAFEEQLGEVIRVSKRVAFPLRQRHAIDYVKPGLALVADAAHTIHPLAGQGINLGLQDVDVLAQELLRASERGIGLGELSVLQRYQRRRKLNNLAMMALMDGFKHLFAEPALPLRFLRNEGMRQLDRLTPLKHLIMKQAMGL